MTDIFLISGIRNLVINTQFVDRHRKQPKAFTRVRKLPFCMIIATILQLARRSLQIVCNLLGDHMTEPASKQAFSKARYNFSHTGFIEINEYILNKTYPNSNKGLWRGFRMLGIDGTTLRLPDSKELKETFGCHTGTKDTKQPTLARVSEVFELTTGIILNAKIGPWSVGERAMAEDQIQSVSAMFHTIGQHNQLYVADRGYISRNIISLILKSKADFLFRIPKSFHHEIDSLINTGKNTQKILKLWDFPPLLAVIRLLPSGEVCALLTSLVDEKLVSANDLFQVYWMRWIGCEEGFKRQKLTLEIENFSGKTIEAVLQDFWATIVVINIFQAYCLEEEGWWDVDQPPKDRINRSVAFGSLKGFLFETILGNLTEDEFKKIFSRIVQRGRIRVRPGRTYSREGVGKPRRYHVFRKVC